MSYYSDFSKYIHVYGYTKRGYNDCVVNNK